MIQLQSPTPAEMGRISPIPRTWGITALVQERTEPLCSPSPR